MIAVTAIHHALMTGLDGAMMIMTAHHAIETAIMMTGHVTAMITARDEILIVTILVMRETMQMALMAVRKVTDSVRIGRAVVQIPALHIHAVTAIGTTTQAECTAERGTEGTEESLATLKAVRTGVHLVARDEGEVHQSRMDMILSWSQRIAILRMLAG